MNIGVSLYSGQKILCRLLNPLKTAKFDHFLAHNLKRLIFFFSNKVYNLMTFNQNDQMV